MVAAAVSVASRSALATTASRIVQGCWSLDPDAHKTADVGRSLLLRRHCRTGGHAPVDEKKRGYSPYPPQDPLLPQRPRLPSRQRPEDGPLPEQSSLPLPQSFLVKRHGEPSVSSCSPSDILRYPGHDFATAQGPAVFAGRHVRMPHQAYGLNTGRTTCFLFCDHLSQENGGSYSALRRDIASSHVQVPLGPSGLYFSDVGTTGRSSGAPRSPANQSFRYG